MDSGRRILYRPEHVAQMRERLRGVLDEAKADLHAMHERHVAELEELRREVAELRSILAIVVSVTRQHAESDLASLRRQLETALARLERDPRKPLN